MEQTMYDQSIKNLHEVINSGIKILSTNMRHTAIERLADKYGANLGGECRSPEDIAMYMEDLDSRGDEQLIEEYVEQGLI